MTTRLLTAVLALAFVVPLAVAGDGYGGPGAGQGGPSDETGAIVAKTLLVRAADSPDDDVCGRVEFLSVAASGRERFRVVVCRLDVEAVIAITIDDGSGNPIDLGEVVADPGGQAVLELDTAGGDDLPGGATAVSQLAGRTVNVYDADEALLLTGSAPTEDDEVGSPWRGKLKLKPEDPAEPRLELKLQRKTRDRNRLRFQVKRLDPDAGYQFCVENSEGGEMALAFEFSTNHRGKCKLKLKAQGDEDLVPGLGGVAELAGLTFQIRTAAGKVVMSGTCPTPGR